MRYVSTRSGIEPINFKEAVMMGLSSDGGLIIPERIPTIPEGQLRQWSGLSYEELAFEIMSLFISDIGHDTLKGLIKSAYSTFSHKEITPIVKAGNMFILELFYGPTYSFKDIALQFLGNLFSFILKEDDPSRKMNIVGATSGDTGSAAIYGVKGKDNINIFILHPHKRVSPVQALQMTTVEEKNVFNIAVEGTFDDCQSIVKAIFNDLEFKEKYRLGAVNSINWARVLAQIVYYVYVALRFYYGKGDYSGYEGKKVYFSVPTGNFGDIFAGYIARLLTGNIIGRLLLATNENNILTRFILEGKYQMGRVVPTISPSMDIQVASNFERYLYYLFDKDGKRVSQTMDEFSKTGVISISTGLIRQVRKDFASASIGQSETIETIRDFYKRYSYILDPHSAVGVAAALRLKREFNDGIFICLATAHPAKFPDAVKRAIGRVPPQPEGLMGLKEKEERLTVLPPDIDRLEAYIASALIKINST